MISQFWFHGLRNCFITVAECDLFLPLSLTKRLVNHTRPSGPATSPKATRPIGPSTAAGEPDLAFQDILEHFDKTVEELLSLRSGPEEVKVGQVVVHKFAERDSRNARVLKLTMLVSKGWIMRKSW